MDSAEEHKCMVRLMKMALGFTEKAAEAFLSPTKNGTKEDEEEEEEEGEAEVAINGSSSSKVRAKEKEKKKEVEEEEEIVYEDEEYLIEELIE